MKMIVGLGNPGSEYRGNRHNLGFMSLDYFSQLHHLGDYRIHKEALILKTQLSVRGRGSERPVDLLLAKPMTYMNLSGNAVSQLQLYYKIHLSDILVITEDIHLDFGTIKIRPQGGSGGHNGLKSISQHLGNDFARLRFGVGCDERIPLEQYVLSDFPKSEQEALPEYLGVIAAAITDFCSGIPLGELMTKYNGKGLKNS